MDDDDEDDDDQPVIVGGKGAGTPKKPTAPAGKNDDRVKKATSTKTFGTARTPEQRKVDDERCGCGEDASYHRQRVSYVGGCLFGGGSGGAFICLRSRPGCFAPQDGRRQL